MSSKQGHPIQAMGFWLFGFLSVVLAVFKLTVAGYWSWWGVMLPFLPALQAYLQQHPQVREEIKESPETFMRKENRFDRPEYTRDRDTTRRELANFDQFLDSHRETAEQLRKDPPLVNNEQFVKSHPDLQAYLQTPSCTRKLAMNAPKTPLVTIAAKTG